MNKTKITTPPLRNPIVQEFAIKLKALTARYAGRLSVAEAIGALEVVKMELFEEQK